MADDEVDPEIDPDRFMEQRLNRILATPDPIRDQAKRELMDLRKGAGIADFDLADYQILSAAYDGDKSEMVNAVGAWLDAEREEKPHYAAAWAALNLDYRIDPTPESAQSDLTQRREALAKQLGMSFRTVTRHEEKGLAILALDIKSRVRRSAREGGLKDLLARYEKPQPVEGDLRTVVRKQAQEIKTMKDVIARLAEQVERLHAMNQRLSELVGN